MRARWPYNRCILCLEERPLTDEHLIPESLAGRLISAILCRTCNSSLGHRYEHAARQDPTVRLLANELHEVIPCIASAMAENQAHIAIGPGPGTKKGFVKNGEFHITPRQEADGSLIQTTPAAKGTIARMLQKDGYDAIFIADALQRIDGAPDNAEVEIAPALRVVKWEITDVKLALIGLPIDPVVPVKTAYEFLALHMGSAVYSNSPPLEDIRRVLQGGQLDPQWLGVERLEAPTAQPFHGIAFEGNEPYAKVQVRLFGKLAFRVSFLRMAVHGPRFQYTHALGTQEEFVSQMRSPKDGHSADE